jgi:hypothetical protein
MADDQADSNDGSFHKVATGKRCADHSFIISQCPSHIQSNMMLMDKLESRKWRVRVIRLAALLWMEYSNG